MNFFDKLNDIIRDTESSIVNFLSAFAPWLAPLTPAYMTYQHAVGTLNFPKAIAFPAAVLVEILGFSAVSTFLAFWFHNRRNQAVSKRAPIEVVVLAFVFYLALIIFSNVLLDSFPNEKWAEIAVKALFTLQTLPAALIVAVRTQHRDLLSEISKERERKLSETPKKDAESNQKVSGNLPKDWRTLRNMLTDADKANLANLTSSQVRDYSIKYQVDVRTITNWRTYARKELGIEDRND